MSKGNNLETDILALIFNATPIPNLADNASVSPETNLAVALHTADPGEAGSQLTSEANYTGYGRVNVARTSGGWTVSGNQVQNTAQIDFPACTGGTSDVTHFSVGYPGSDEILYSGTVTPTLAISNGVTPFIAAGGMTITED